MPLREQQPLGRSPRAGSQSSACDALAGCTSPRRAIQKRRSTPLHSGRLWKSWGGTLVAISQSIIDGALLTLKRPASSLQNSRPSAVIISAGTAGTLVLQQTAGTVPIVFVIVNDPVAQGIVQSLDHPGGNITGFSYLEPTIGAKWIELLKEIAPDVTRIARMFNPDANPSYRFFYQSMGAAAPKFGVQTAMAQVHTTSDIEEAMLTIGHEAGGGLIISPDSFNYTNRKLIIELAARHRLPAVYGILGTAAEGGLIYYSVDVVDQFRSAAGYVDRILHGTKPADLPVQLPTKFFADHQF